LRASFKGNPKGIIRNNLCGVADDCGPDPMSQGQSEAIFTNGAGAGTVISSNKAFNNDVGIYLFSSEGCCTTENNKLTNNRYFGLAIHDGNNIVSHNIISGGQVGIGVMGDSVDTIGNLDNNVISGTSLRPVQEISCCGFTAMAIITRFLSDESSPKFFAVFPINRLLEFLW